MDPAAPRYRVTWSNDLTLGSRSATSLPSALQVFADVISHQGAKEARVIRNSDDKTVCTFGENLT